VAARSRTKAIDEGPEREQPLGPDAWSAFLSREFDAPIEVTFTRARRTVLKLEPRGGVRNVRMNEFFARAPLEVRSAVVSWIRSGRRARRKLEVLDAWVEAQIEHVERSAPRKLRVVTRGRVHDIEALAGELRATEFAGEFGAGGANWPRLTWGRAPRSSSRRTLRLGSFDVWSCVVRLHPVLDQEFVPEFFVRYVLFHELLHAALPAERSSAGRRIFHSPRFRRREREYSGTSAALAWEKKHLRELLISARTGADIRSHNVAARAVAALDRKRASSPPPASERGLRRFVQRWLFS
jgi:hypothetical protein